MEKTEVSEWGCEGEEEDDVAMGGKKLIHEINTFTTISML